MLVSWSRKNHSLFSPHSEFKEWRAQGDTYTSLSGLAKQEQVMQVQALTLCFLWKTITIVKNTGLTAAQHQDGTQIVVEISEWVEGQINESIERHHFCQRHQQPGESFDNFLVHLQNWLRLVASAQKNALRNLFGTNLLKEFWTMMPWKLY